VSLSGGIIEAQIVKQYCTGIQEGRLEMCVCERTTESAFACVV